MKIEKRVEKINKIRNEGFVPGVLFGKTIDSTSIQAEYKELFETYKTYGKSKTFKVKLDNKTHQVYIKDIQLDTFKPNNIIHFSLLKIMATDSMHAEIPVHAVGKNEVERKGLILQVVIPTLEVEFPVGAGVNVIDVDVSALDADHAIHIKDLVLPEGFKLHLDPEAVVINAAYPKVVEEEPATEPAEPEVVGEEKEDAEDAE
jgi:large subunit ribosomal protein L25